MRAKFVCIAAVAAMSMEYNGRTEKLRHSENPDAPAEYDPVSSPGADYYKGEPGTPEDGYWVRKVPREEIRLSAVASGSEENKSFATYTPHGELQMTITNPACFGFYVQGKEYYIDITECVHSD